MYPDPLFSLFGSEVNLYGIFIAIGILVCFLVYFLYTKKDGMDKDLQSFTFYVAIISIVLGFLAAALFQSFYVFLETGVFKFGVGITVMGGLLGGAGTFLLVYFLVGKFYFQGEKKDIHKKQ